MAWPLDAKDHTFSALGQVPSDTLNEVQDRIVDLHRDRTIMVSSYFCETDGANLPSWTQHTTEPWFTCRAAYSLSGRIGLPHGSIVKSVKVKLWLDAATGMKLDLYADDTNMAVSATVPTALSIGDQLAPTYSVAAAWFTAEWSTGVAGFTDWTVPADNCLRVLIDDPDASDRISGIQVTYQPITPTP